MPCSRDEGLEIRNRIGAFGVRAGIQRDHCGLKLLIGLRRTVGFERFEEFGGLHGYVLANEPLLVRCVDYAARCKEVV